MNSDRFADFTRTLDANPRFYDRCIAVCSVLLVLCLLGVIFLKVNDRPRLEIRGMASIQETIGPNSVAQRGTPAEQLS